MAENQKDGGVKSPGRRRFMGTMVGLSVAWVGAMLYPLYKYVAPRAAVDPFGKDGLAKVEGLTASDVAQPGTGGNCGFAGGGLIVLRDKQGELKAFNSKCTHAGCTVSYQTTQLYCNCHGGTYNLDGKNVAGPPPKPLAEYDIIEDQGALFLKRPTQS